MSEELIQQIIELQAKAVFQEDLLQSLNQIVIEQDKTIRALTERVQRWESKLDDMSYAIESGGTPQSEVPPHY